MSVGIPESLGSVDSLGDASSAGDALPEQAARTQELMIAVKR
jgi:hypothetical protein